MKHRRPRRRSEACGKVRPPHFGSRHRVRVGGFWADREKGHPDPGGSPVWAQAPPIWTRAVNVVSLTRTQPVSDAGPRARALASQALWNSSSLVVQIGSIFALTALAFRQLPSSEVGTFALVSVTVGLVQTLDPAAAFVMARVVAERAGGRPFDDRVIPQLRAGLRTVALGLAGLTGLGFALASV